MPHIEVEIVTNDDVSYIAIGNTENHITPESFQAFASEVVKLAAENGTVHLSLQLSDETIPYEEVEDEPV